MQHEVPVCKSEVEAVSEKLTLPTASEHRQKKVKRKRIDK
jgi:hypothetical protein